MTTETVYNKAIEIKNQMGGIKPPVFIERIAKELKIDKPTAVYHLDLLKLQGRVKFNDTDQTTITVL